MKLLGKKIVLGISGSIAAYKSAILCRLLIKNGAEVRVVMTPSATDFITPTTLSTLSNHQVFDSIHDGHSWNGHVELGLWADLMIIAPATANTLAHLAHGICNNMLDAVYLSARCPVFIAPAMDLEMWQHPTTKQNISQLQQHGKVIIPVENGFLASGLMGEGRMAEPESIFDFVSNHFNNATDLKEKRILITAGPTYENIDPVRFIGNFSSGKMGLALARQCVNRGAQVELVLGPVIEHVLDSPNINIHKVRTAEEMYGACLDAYPSCDIAIFAAAVADYRPAIAEENKIKKQEDRMTLQLVKTVDIAKSLGELKRSNQLNIGFALETNDEQDNAIAKRKKKNFDLIVLNSTRDKGATFGTDSNKITIYNENGKIMETQLLPKDQIANLILDEIIKLF